MSAILDTCIVSELYDANAEPAVVQRVNELGADAYLSVITIGELFRGTQLLEPGRRQRALIRSLRRTEQRFAQRILPIDTEVARVWGRITAETRGVGREVPPLDGLIAATALHHGMTVMTRNVRHFAPTGVEVVDPWPT